MKNKNNFKKIIFFILIFFLFWTIRQYLYLYVDSTLDGFVKTLFGILIKFIFWIGLGFIYSRKIFKQNLFKALQFQNKKKGGIYAILFALVLLSLNLIYNYLSKGILFDIDFSIGTFISAVIFAPIIEETIFRGFILKKLDSSLPFFWANILTAFLFMLIHFPGWIIWGNGITLVSSISIFLVSFIWGYLYKKTNCFLSPVLAHGLNNLISMIV